MSNTSIAVVTKHNGQGELRLSKEIISEFYSYITTRNQNNPLNFFITQDHKNTFVIIDKNAKYRGYSGSGPIGRNKKKCEIKYKQTCFLFSNQRYIVWNNGINPIKKENSLLKRKISIDELQSKLLELGFIESKEQKLAKEKKIAEEKAAEEKKIAEEKVVKEKKIAEEKAAEEKKIAEEKVAKEKKIAEEKAAEEKLNKKLSLFPKETELDKAQSFLMIVKDFIKFHSNEFDIIEISKFFIKTKPILDGNFNDTLEENYRLFKEYTNQSQKFVKFKNNFEIKNKKEKILKINKVVNDIEFNMEILKNFMVKNPESVYMKEWVLNYENAQKVIKEPKSYDQLLTMKDNLKLLIESNEQTNNSIIIVKKNIEELKKILSQNLTSELAPLILKNIENLEKSLKTELIPDMNLAIKEFEIFIKEKINKSNKNETIKNEKPNMIKLFKVDISMDTSVALDALKNDGWKCIPKSHFENLCLKSDGEMITIKSERFIFNCKTYKGCSYTIKETRDFFEKELKIKIRDNEIIGDLIPRSALCGVGAAGDKICVVNDNISGQDDRASIYLMKHKYGSSGMTLN